MDDVYMNNTWTVKTEKYFTETMSNEWTSEKNFHFPRQNIVLLVGTWAAPRLTFPSHVQTTVTSVVCCLRCSEMVLPLKTTLSLMIRQPAISRHKLLHVSIFWKINLIKLHNSTLPVPPLPSPSTHTQSVLDGESTWFRYTISTSCISPEQPN